MLNAFVTPYSFTKLYKSPCSGYAAIQLIMCILYVKVCDAGQLARSQYPEGPATGHLDTGFSWFPLVQERMLRWFPPFQVAFTCFSCSPPDLNSVVTNCLLSYYVK